MSEPWIRVHANLAGKPVVWRAVEALAVTPHEAIGLLVQFWGSVSQHAQNGEVASLPDAQLEVWAGWRGKHGKFAAFIRSTHLDPDGRVNEWDEYAGALENRRAKERIRKANERERKSREIHADSPQDVTRTESGQGAGHHADTGRDVTLSVRPAHANDTKRYDTKTLTTTAPTAARDGNGGLAVTARAPRTRTAKQLPPYDQLFEEAWAHYPSRPGNNKAEAWEQWLHRVREGVDPVAMLSGTLTFRRYVDGRTWDDRRHILMGRTFYGPKKRFEDSWGDDGSTTFTAPPVSGGWMSSEVDRITRPA